MNKTEVLEALKKKCTCFFDADNQELWKCAPCVARDYIEVLANRLNGIGCTECDVKIKEMLK